MAHDTERTIELELTRVRGDRRLYALEGIGTLRLTGLWSRSAEAQAGERNVTFRHRGLLGRASEAADEAGTVIGDFAPRALRRGGTLRWGGRELTLRTASSWRERYALAEGERELAVLDGRGWGRRPVLVALADPSSLDPALVLFAAFVVRSLAEDASSAAAGGATVASTTGC